MLIVIIFILGLIGIDVFTMDNKIWSQISLNIQSQSFFLYSFASCMFIGTCFVRESNVKLILKICLFSSIIILGLVFLPLFKNSYFTFLILGIILGILSSALFYIGIFGTTSELKVKIIGIVLFTVYFCTYLLNHILSITNSHFILTAIMVIFSITFFLIYKVKFEGISSPNLFKKHTFPSKLILLLGLVIFVSYFETFLVGYGVKLIDVSKGIEWVFQIVHLIIYLGFYISGKKLKYSRILYISLISTVFAYIFGVLPILNSKILVCIFYSISDSLGDIFLYNLLAEIVFKHGKRPLVFSVLILTVAIGTISALYIGERASILLQNRTILIYGIFLILFCGYLLLLPYLSKYIKVETDEFNNSLRAVKSSTAIFNHSLKNMIIQVSCAVEVLKKNHNFNNDQIKITLDIMSDTINQIMDIVKHINLNTEEVNIEKKLNNMEDIIDSVINSIQLILKNRSIQITKTCCQNSFLYCDKKRVKETLFNIVKNALEAITIDNGEIKIEVSKTRRKLVCKITDNGRGIPSNQIENLFKPFYTTKKLETNNYGLGLTHCYIVMEQHKGKIEVKSKENVGTCISLIFSI